MSSYKSALSTGKAAKKSTKKATKKVSFFDDDIEATNGGALVEKSTNIVRKKKKATIEKTAHVNSKSINYTLEFETAEIPEKGSDAMFDAIFKAAKTCGKLTAQDLEDIEKEKKKFWSTPCFTTTKKDKAKIETKQVNQEKDKPVSQNSVLNTSQDQERLDFLAEVDALINSPEPAASSTFSITSQTLESPPISKRSKKSTSKKPVTIIAVTLESSDEEGTGIEEQKPHKDFGNLVLFQISLRGVTYPMRIHENKKIREVREMLSLKSGLPSECLTMFLGDEIQLEDDKSVKETGVYDLCNVDAYYKEETLAKLYERGSDAVIQFKLQTSDRRGRQTVYVYAKKTSPMRSVRDDYAKEMGMEPDQLRLMFDGDVINLDNIPADCDLEGEECLDVIVK